ncbi:MAG: hydroxyacylglutathione hydrolase [Magnetococcales bacterium]|nr:hydroxyacylglutathione hydrolase [Magnetococcales bacterium]MBF0347986.1 hydroxyacylglutathione hydrolase [Magnetococcales bacterium]
MPATTPVVYPIPVGADNYVWLMETAAGDAVIFDPGDFAPVADVLQRSRLNLTHILITHHHHDHTDGVTALARHFGARVIGHARDAGRLPPLDLAVGDGDAIPLGPLNCEVMATPGHTLGHVVYRIGDALFTGDTLFSLGCGRLFEGTAEMMWDSLRRLRALSGIGRVFPAHEYTLANLGFVLKLEPEREDLASLKWWVHEQTDQGKPTLPTTMERELQFNPFLRADDPDFVQRIGMTGNTAVAVFAHVRTMRNHH